MDEVYGILDAGLDSLQCREFLRQENRDKLVLFIYL
jgi:hypothetical protein